MIWIEFALTGILAGFPCGSGHQLEQKFQMIAFRCHSQFVDEALHRKGNPIGAWRAPPATGYSGVLHCLAQPGVIYQRSGKLIGIHVCTSSGLLAILGKCDAVHWANINTGITLDTQRRRKHRLYVAVQTTLRLIER